MLPKEGLPNCAPNFKWFQYVPKETAKTGSQIFVDWSMTPRGYWNGFLISLSSSSPKSYPMRVCKIQVQYEVSILESTHKLGFLMSNVNSPFQVQYEQLIIVSTQQLNFPFLVHIDVAFFVWIQHQFWCCVMVAFCNYWRRQYHPVVAKFKAFFVKVLAPRQLGVA